MPRPLVALIACALPLLSADGDEFFEAKIRPLLATHCHACHTGGALGNLRLDSREGILKGGKSGKVVVEGKPESSLLIEAVKRTHVRLKMPPVGALTKDEIASLAFTGRDTASGKSWDAWVKKYFEKKAAGEKNIELKPENLD